MKRNLLIILLLAPILLMSCSPRSSDPLAYQRGALSAEVTLEKNGTRIGAVIRLGESVDSSRDAEIVFTAPSSIKGLTVERKSGRVTARLGDLSVTPNARALFLADLFSLDGAVTEVKTENGLSRLTLACAEAEYTLTLDATGHPKSISGKDFTLEILWLENDR